MVTNRAVIFANVPVGLPKPGKDLVVKDSEFDIEQAPPAGGITIKLHYSSFDPYMRGRMRPANVKSYSPAYDLGGPINSSGIASVLKSDTSSFAPGDLVTGVLNIKEYDAISAETIKALGLKKVDNPLGLDPVIFIGTLGMPGLTAYSSFYAIGKPKKGETIFISAASGAVGQLVGQLAKREGLKVIGSVGSDEKLEYILKELEFDGGFNYKKEKASEALPRLAPQGVDIYYENVGGEQLAAAIDNLNNFGRIVACGMVSEYNKTEDEKYPIRNLMQIVAKRITFQGFIVGDPALGPAYKEEFVKNVSKWLADGSLKVLVSVTDGIENAPEGYVGLLQGKNLGKAVLKVSEVEKK